MICVEHLTKRFGRHAAVDDLSFTVRPGHVTGFLGPNGAGKSTTMRLALGLVRPTAGAVTVAGRPYRALPAPLHEVGALLDAGALHPGRRARHHLLALARSNRIPDRRVDEVLDLVGLAAVAGRRAGQLSLGMRQRLGLAAALLGDPAVLLLDEPVNGLDTEGIRWIRGLLGDLAAEGRTVLVSSHLMSEMELTADRLIVIGRGRLLADTTVEALVAGGSGVAAVVRSPRLADLAGVIEAGGGRVAPDAPGAARVTGLDAAAVGDLAAGAGIALHELRPLRSTLEEVYSALTSSDVEHRTRAGTGARP